MEKNLKFKRISWLLATAFIISAPGSVFSMDTIKSKAQSVESANELIRAASRGDLAEVNRLINAGVDVNAEGTMGGPGFMRETALFLAVNNKQNAIVDRLISAGVRMRLELAHELTLLGRVAWRGDLGLLKKLLTIPGIDVNGQHAGQTALSWAATGSNKAMVDALLAAGADPNIRDGKHEFGWGVVPGSTPLIRAVKRGNMPIIEALLAAGADPNIRDADGYNALKMAVRGAYRSPPGQQQGIVAALPIVAVLLDVGADPRGGLEMARYLGLSELATFIENEIKKRELSKEKT